MTTTAPVDRGNLTDAEIAERLRHVPTTTALDILRNRSPHQLVLRGVRPLFPQAGTVAGVARTVRFLPVRADHRIAPDGPANFQLIDRAEPGEFLVFDTGGSKEGSVLGDMLALRAKMRGAAGVVTDGAMRDQAGLREVGLPVFCAGVFPVPSAPTLAAWARDVPVQCGGALVLPGDWILADQDAVIVVPASWIHDVLSGLEVFNEEEHFCRQLLQRGDGLIEAYPLPLGSRVLFEEYQNTGKLPSRASLLRAIGKEREDG
ncbi:hypothetical protein K2O51_33675 (plasmid) [Cupriavidus pinatubonensis]|uniref:RraA family protein n=1 Tax=Cupriavidus pinatubonensis TaxID=248026 RepID=UPI001C731837|nr:hypothetical protein [Cupriavidus pinatubonensis]QYY33794.1 hypothetical protein K2O51_33675 [Cupriavidus pinatubonensis]